MAEQVYRIERVRLYPTPAQLSLLSQYAGTHRFMWNWALAERQRIYAETSETLDYNAQNRALTQMQRQPETAWLVSIPRRVKVGALRDLDKAYRAAFRRIKAGEPAGFPRFKAKKRGEATFEIPADTRFEGRRVRIQGIGWVRARGGREIAIAARTGRFFRDRAGDWWAALTYPVTLPAPIESPPEPVGVHLQLEHALTLSTGESVAQPNFAAAADRKLRRLQRALSRKQAGSANREKARVKKARFERHVANQRREWAHRTAHQIVSDHPVLAMQERDTRALITEPESQRAVWQGRKRTTRIHDAGWAMVTRLLSEKAVAAGGAMIVVPGSVPTARTCSHCGHVVSQLSLMIREWDCPRCGVKHVRGINAAINIREEGKRLGNVAGKPPETQNASEPVVRPLRGRMGMKEESP